MPSTIKTSRAAQWATLLAGHEKLKDKYARRDFTGDTLVMASVQFAASYSLLDKVVGAEEESLLKVLAYAGECLDYFNCFNPEYLDHYRSELGDAYNRVRRHFRALYDRLPGEVESGKRGLWRERVRCILTFCVNEDFRLQEYKDCVGRIEVILKFVEERLVSEPAGFYCSGTLGQLKFHYSRAARATYQYDLSDRLLTEAHQHYQEKLYRVNTLHRGQDRAYRTLAVWRQMAMLTVARAWLLYQRGAFAEASRAARVALEWLADTNDEMNKKYAEIVLAGIGRIRANTVSDLEQVIKDLRRIIAFFGEDKSPYVEGSKNPRGQSSAAWEFVLACLVCDTYDVGNDGRWIDKADEAVKHFWSGKSLPQVQDRWESQASALKSRIDHKRARRQAEEGERRRLLGRSLLGAKDSLERAERCGLISLKIDAHIVLAEVCTTLGDYPKAREHYETAKRLNGGASTDGPRVPLTGHPEIAAVCLLGLARVALCVNHLPLALEYYLMFQSELEGRIQYSWVKRRADLVKRDIEDLRLRHVVIEVAEDDELEIDYYLYCHLIPELRRKAESRIPEGLKKGERAKEVVKLLGGSGESTLRGWDRRAKHEEKLMNERRARRKGSVDGKVS